jgi:hypothetical protein
LQQIGHDNGEELETREKEEREAPNPGKAWPPLSLVLLLSLCFILVLSVKTRTVL